MRISDWSSDVCASDLDCAETENDRAAGNRRENDRLFGVDRPVRQSGNLRLALALPLNIFGIGHRLRREGPVFDRLALRDDVVAMRRVVMIVRRSEEHTSELQSLMRISYAVFCLKKTTQYN